MRTTALAALLLATAHGAQAQSEPLASAGLPVEPSASAPTQAEPVGADAGAEGSFEVSGDGSAGASWEGRFGLGFAAPSLADEFTASYNPGGQLAAEVGLGFSELHLALSLGYARLPFNTNRTSTSDAPTEIEGTIVSASIDGGSLNLAAAMLQGRWDMTQGSLRPYLAAGGGMAWTAPEKATVNLTLVDDMGETSTQEFAQDPDNSIDPMLMLGIGATDVSGPLDFFGQLHVNLLLGDEVVPLFLASVGVGI